MSNKLIEDSPDEDDTLSKVIISMRSALSKPIKRKEVKAKLAKLKHEAHCKMPSSTDTPGAKDNVICIDSKISTSENDSYESLNKSLNSASESEEKILKQADNKEWNFDSEQSCTSNSDSRLLRRLKRSEEKESQPRTSENDSYESLNKSLNSASESEEKILKQADNKEWNFDSEQSCTSSSDSRLLRRLKRSEEKESQPRIVLTIRRTEDSGDNKRRQLKIHIPDSDNANSSANQAVIVQVDTKTSLKHNDEFFEKQETKTLLRPSRKINPTAKVLANRELSRELEQTNKSKSSSKFNKKIIRSHSYKKRMLSSSQRIPKKISKETAVMKHLPRRAWNQKFVKTSYIKEHGKIKYLQQLGLKSVPSKRFKKAGDSPSMDQCSNESDLTEQGQNLSPNCVEEDTDSKDILKCSCSAPCDNCLIISSYEEPLFCNAVSSVEDRRLGCSEVALKYSNSIPLLRSGLKVHFTPLCGLHLSQTQNHMCCPECGLFCTQGIFYQCSEKHYFHIDCYLISTDNKEIGCPHCGRQNNKLVNTDVWRVKMRIQNKNVAYVPEQRIECTNAFMSFRTIDYVNSRTKILSQELVTNEILQDVDLIKSENRQDSKIDVEVMRKLCHIISSNQKADRSALAKLIAKVNPNSRVASAANGTLLHLAVYNANLLATLLLHNAGADLNAVDREQRTPILLVIQRLIDLKKAGEAEMCDLENRLLKTLELLCWTGANFRGSALQAAAAGNVCSALRILLESRDLSPDDTDAGGWTPLVWAAENNHTQAVRLLLEYGADPNAVDSEGNTALHWSAQAGSVHTLQLLLNTAAHISNQTNSHGETPLHMASRSGHFGCVIALLARGAKADIKNKLGETPQDCATKDCWKTIELSKSFTEFISKPEITLSSDISNGRERLAISCVNGVDGAVLPTFNYVSEHIFSEPIAVDNTLHTLQGCECVRNCSSGCPCAALSVKNWMKQGRLDEDFPQSDPPMLFECNASCRCNAKSCGNRSVSRLLREGATWVPVSVYRIGQQAEWALRADVKVCRGVPVATYAGEVLPTAKANQRRDDHYVFAIELKSDLLEECHEKTLLSVDASNYGSAARFINHSCSPNLAPVQVFTSHRDLRLPHIVFFATRDIDPGEQLTFDYGEQFWSVKLKSMHCLCGSANCRYSEET